MNIIWESEDIKCSVSDSLDKFKEKHAEYVYYKGDRSVLNYCDDASLHSGCPELDNDCGVYVLYSKDANGKPRIYAGKATMGILKRLKQHHDSKVESYRDKWDKFIAVTTVGNLTSAEVTDVERLLIDELKRLDVCGKCECLNGNRGSKGGANILVVRNFLDRVISILESGKVNIKIPEMKTDLDAVCGIECANYINDTVERIKREVEEAHKLSVDRDNDWLNKVNKYEEIQQMLAEDCTVKYKGRVCTPHDIEIEKYNGTFRHKSDVVVKDALANTCVNMLDRDKNDIYIDLCSSSGEFSTLIIRKYFEGLQGDPDSIREQLMQFIRNNVYAVCINKATYILTLYSLLSEIEECINRIYNGKVSIKKQNVDIPNVVLVENLKTDIKDIKKAANTVRGILRENGGDKMNFNNAILNGPYNNGMDIDFSYNAVSVADKNVVEIKPAKWQTADPNQKISSTKTYGQFRKDIVPHISEVIYFPNSLDVFENVYQMDGISIIKIVNGGANECIDKCKVTNVQDVINKKVEEVLRKYEGDEYVSREVVYRDIKNGQSLLNIGQEIIDSMGEYESFKPSEYMDTTGKYTVWMNNLLPGNQQVSNGGFLGMGKAYISDVRPDKIQVIPVFSSDSEEQCKNFLDFIQHPLNRFAIIINTSKLTGYWCDYGCRFMPKHPTGNFNGRFSDEYIYKFNNVSEKYIAVIEAIMKERK